MSGKRYTFSIWYPPALQELVEDYRKHFAEETGVSLPIGTTITSVLETALREKAIKRGSMQMSPTEIIQKIREAKAEKERLVMELQKKKDEVLMQLGKEAFLNHPKIKGFLVIGYTPSFNDGDPCTHWQAEWEFEALNEEQIEDEEEFFEKDREGSDDGVQFFEDNQELLEDLLGTNWEVTWKLEEDGSITVNHQDDTDYGN